MEKRSNEERLELFADLIEPAAEILGDKAVADTMRTGTRAAAVSAAIKGHKKAVITILAALDGVAVADYRVPGPVGIMKRLLELINDPEIQELFTLQAQKPDAADSGSAMENTEGGAN